MMIQINKHIVISMEFPKVTRDLKEKWLDLMIKILPVQPVERDKFKNFLTWALYVLNYLIILYIISHKTFNKVQSSNLIIIAINITRAVLNLAYIVSKHKIFFVLQKISILVHCIVTCNGYTQFFKPLLLLDLASGVVWSLSLQQKSVHFDSRLFISTSLIKELGIAFFYFAWIAFHFGRGFQQLFYIGFALILILVDFKTNYYRKKFKRFMLGLDLCCLISASLPVLQFLADQTIKYHLIILIINLICVVAAVHFSTPSFRILHQIDPWLNSVQSQQMIDYVIDLEQLTRFDQDAEVVKYIIHHIRQCPVPGCFLKYHERDNHHPTMKAQEVLKIFNAQQLQVLCKKYPILSQYLLFNTDIRNKQVRNSANLQNFFHRRENERFQHQIQSQSEKNKEEKRTPQLGVELNLVPKIKLFTELGLQFWTELLQNKINSSKLLQIGAKAVKSMKQINKIYKENRSLDLKSQEMIHLYLMYLLGQGKSSTAQRNRPLQIQDNLSGFAEAPPTLLVSAEKQNFLRIMNVNISAVKVTGFTKEQATSITVDLLWDKEIRLDHITLAERRARYSTASEGQLIRSYAFLKTKFGYVVMADGVVYYFDDISGKKWCVVLYPFLDNQPVLVTNSKRQLIGISESCVSFGLRTDLQGLKINESLFSSCVKTGKPTDLQPGLDFFQNRRFVFKNMSGFQLYLKFETKIDFMNKPTYYIFTLGMNKIKTGARDSLSQIDLKFQGSKHSLSAKANLPPPIPLIPSISHMPLFQFCYNVEKNTFERKMDEKLAILASKDLRDEIDEHDSQSKSHFVRQVNIQDIIEMRLWDNKIDFLQNWASPIPAFGSLPTIAKEDQHLDQEKVKTQWQTRSEQAPAQIKWLRSLFIILLVVSTALIIFLNVMVVKNKELKQDQIISHQTLLKQHGQLIDLTSILLQPFYEPNIDIQAKLNISIGKIDETYKSIESMSTINNYLAKSDDQHSLFKADDIYRLLIKNYLSKTGQLDDVIFQLIKSVSTGWQQITQYDFVIIDTQTTQSLSGYLIFMATSSLFIVASSLVYLYFRIRIQRSAEQICKIFLMIDQHALASQVTKFKSFKEYIDLDRSLIKEQKNVNENDEDIQQNMYPKCTGNPEKFKLQSFALIIGLVIMGVYFGLVSREQYNVESVLHKHIRYLHSSNLQVLQSRKLWVGLNTKQFHTNFLEEIKLKIFDFKRDLQILNNQQLGNKYFSSDYKNFWISLSYQDLCIYLPSQHSDGLELMVKNGQKQLVYNIIRLYNRCIIKYSSLSQLITSREANLLYQVNKYYMNFLNSVTSSKIQEEFNRLVEDSKNFLASSVIIYLFSLILIVVSYLLLARKIKQNCSLEEILYTVPFKEIQSNHKFIQYLNEVKISRR